MPSGGTWVKMLTIGTSICIGGPALVYWVSPTEEELFKKYNPDLQKRSLETRDVRQQEFDTFVSKLKEYSKSDRPIWVVAAEDERRTKRETAEKKEAERLRLAGEKEKLRNEIRRHSSGREA